MSYPKICVVGYQPKPDVPLEDYPDFPIGREFRAIEIQTMQRDGVMPPGLILQVRGGEPCVVKGAYGTHQKIVKLQPER